MYWKYRPAEVVILVFMLTRMAKRWRIADNKQEKLQNIIQRNINKREVFWIRIIERNWRYVIDRCYSTH
jgi:hypothetical protein